MVSIRCKLFNPRSTFPQYLCVYVYSRLPCLSNLQFLLTCSWCTCIYHLSSSLPHIYAQVPSYDHSMTPDDTLKHFQQEVPALSLLGTPHYIKPGTPYFVDSEVQLVCKYLKAMHVGGKNGIDKLHERGRNCMHVFVGRRQVLYFYSWIISLLIYFMPKN